MTDNQYWLADYAKTGSDAAFRELVTRYVDLVYSTALRLVGGDSHRAEDVAQTVFVNLARVARTLPKDVKLGGWLHRDTCFTAATLMRGERRRQTRERQAAEMNAMHNSPNADYSLIAPVLDEAINELEETDRTAILLRFYEQNNFRAVGNVLGSNEDAARMRVARALDKLEGFLKRRGITTTAASLGVALSANAVQAAPVGLALTISTAAALTGTALATTATVTATKAIAMTALQKTLVTTTIAILAGAGIYEAHQAAQLREQVQTLTQQQAPLVAQNKQLQSERDDATNRLAVTAADLATANSNKRELLKLRGDVGWFRQQTNEIGRLQQENRKLIESVASQIETTNQVSAEDKFTLQKSHAIDAMTTLLRASVNHAANHSGQLPDNFEQLAVSGHLGVTNFPDELGLGDFEFIEKGTVDQEGNKAILRKRVSIQRPGGGSMVVVGGVSEGGAIYTKMIEIPPE